MLEAFGSRPDLDSYLLQQGFAARGLLGREDGAGGAASARIEELPAAAAASGDPAAAAAAAAELERRRAGLNEESDALVQLVDGVGRTLEAASARAAEFGAWLLSLLGVPAAAPAKGEAEGQAEGSGGPRKSGGAAGNNVFENFGRVAVVLVLLMLLRRAVRGA